MTLATQADPSLRTIAQDGRPPPTLVQAPVLRNTRHGVDHGHLVLDAPSIARSARPGQFVLLTVSRDPGRGPVLPRPMAIYDTRRDREVHVVYRIVGSGTEELATFGGGETITTVGPLGQPFSVPTRPGARLVLLGRGIGACSLTLLARAASEQHVDVAAITSARVPSALVGRDVYDTTTSHLVEVTDHDGTSDPDQVRGHLRRLAGDHDELVIATCGSARLLAAARDVATATGARLQVSLEARMACGLGYCHGCSTGQVGATQEAPLVCVDGPVFDVALDD